MADNKQLILSRANSAVIARDFSLAARLYKTLLNDDPNDVNLLKRLGSVYQKAGQDENALTVYKRISNDAESALEMGAIYRRLKKYDESIAVLEQAMVFGGDPVKVNYNMGFTYRQMKEFDAAISCFEKVLDQNPNDVLVFNHIGAIHAERGNHSKAIAAYMRGLKIDQNHPILNLNIAKSYEKSGNLKNAINAYEAALRAKPGMLEAVESYSNLLIRENKMKEAYDVVNNAVRLNPNNVEMRVKLGNVYERQSIWDKAEDEYEAALERSDDYIPAMFGLADSQENQGKFEDAVRTMRRAEELNPEDVPTLQKAAHVLMSANYLPAAFDKLNRLVTKDKDNLETLNLMGQYYICTGEENSRDETFNRIAAINPLYYKHYSEGGKRYKNMGDATNAHLLLKKALEKNPQDTGVLLVLAAVYESLKQYDVALAMYQKADNIDGSNVFTKKAINRLQNNSGMAEEVEEVPDIQLPEIDLSDNAPQTPEETDKEFESNGLEVDLNEDLDESVVQAEEPLEEETAPLNSSLAEDDEFDFEQFGMENLIDDEEDLNEAIFKDDESFNEKPMDAEGEVKNLDDLLDDDTPVDIEDEEPVIPIPDGSLNDMPFEDENPSADTEAPAEEDMVFQDEDVTPEPFDDSVTTLPSDEPQIESEADTVSEEEPVIEEQPEEKPAAPVQTVEAKIADEDLQALKNLAEKAQDALEKANYAADRAWNAAQQAADIASASRNAPEKEEEFIEDAKFGLDALNDDEPEEEIKDPQQLLLERAVKMLPSIVRVISDKSAVEQFKSTLEMFKKLRELLEYLPEGKKQEFLQSQTRLLLDYVIARLSGIPGLYETAKALRDGGLVKADEDFVEEKEGIELTKKVLDEMCLMISYIDDGNMRAALMQTADELYQKLPLE